MYCARVLSVNAIMLARNKNTNVRVRVNTCRTSCAAIVKFVGYE